MPKRTSIQCSQILDQNLLLAVLVQKLFWRSMWRILQYILLFSSYFDYSIQKQPKTAEYLILYTLCDMKNAFYAFLTKNNDYNAFSLNLRIFHIHLLSIRQN